MIKSLKSPSTFICELCDYKCSKNSEYIKHNNTRKHAANISGDIKNLQKIFKCEYCNKTYNSRNGLWKHNKICNKPIINENIIIDTSSNEIKILTNLVLEIVKSNTDLQKQCIEFQKQNQDLQKQVLDVCKNNQTNNINSNNHTTTNNKTFNLNFFLNEQCKDAMNISEFVNSVQLNLEDLERVGRQGYVDGIAHIISEKLKDTDIYKRPFHCSDAKRETLYVKDTNGWEREGADNLKMVKAVKDVGQKNFPILNEYRVLHPECIKADSEYNDKYVQMMIQAAGSQKDNVNKVIKKLAKEVVIEKNNY